MPKLKEIFSDEEVSKHVKTPDQMKDFGYEWKDFERRGFTIDQIRTLRRSDRPASYLWSEEELKRAGVSAPWICSAHPGEHTWGSGAFMGAKIMGAFILGTAKNKCTRCHQVQEIGKCENRDPAKQEKVEKEHLSEADRQA